MELLKRKITIKISLIFILLSFGCSFYSLKGSLPAHIKTISISPVRNESSEFGINEKINEIVVDKFISENILDLTDDVSADSRLNIIIKRIENNPYTYNVQSPIIIGIKCQDGSIKPFNLIEKSQE